MYAAYLRRHSMDSFFRKTEMVSNIFSLPKTIFWGFGFHPALILLVVSLSKIMKSIDQKPALKMIAGDATDSYGCSEEPQGPNGRQVWPYERSSTLNRLCIVDFHSEGSSILAPVTWSGAIDALPGGRVAIWNVQWVSGVTLDAYRTVWYRFGSPSLPRSDRWNFMIFQMRQPRKSRPDPSKKIEEKKCWRPSQFFGKKYPSSVGGDMLHTKSVYI